MFLKCNEKINLLPTPKDSELDERWKMENEYNVCYRVWKLNINTTIESCFAPFDWLEF